MDKKPCWNKLYTVFSVLAFTLIILLTGRADVKAAAAPTGLHQTAATDTSVTVEWDAVFGNSKVWTRISNNESMSPCTCDRSYSTSDYFYSLTPGQTYYVQVGSTDSNVYGSEAPADTVWSAPVRVVTAPEKIASENIKFTKATTNSLTFTWAAPVGATSYNVKYYLSSANADNAATVTTDTNSITIAGLQADNEYNIVVEPVRTDPTTGFTAVYNSTSSYYIPTLAQKVSGVALDIFNSSGYIWFDWDRCNVADGYEVEIYKYNGKKALVKGSVTSNYFYTTSSKLKTSQVYKLRVRAYVNNSDNQKSYSTWTSYQYCSRMLDTATVKKSGSKMKVSWKKVKGASSYIIYMATGSSSKTYKKMGTTTKISYTINKNIKKNSDYYIRIVPVYKNGKKSVNGFVKNKSDYTVHVWYSSSGKMYVYNY